MYRTSRAAIALMAVASTLPATITTAIAGEGSGSAPLSDAARREINRRQENIRRAEALLIEGREAYAKGDFQQAVDKFGEAKNLLPEAPIFADRRASVIQHLTNASVALAQQQIHQGGKDPAKGGKGTLTLRVRAWGADPA